MAHEVHQIGAIAAVVDGEGGIEPDRRGMLAQQPRADRVKRPGPGQPAREDGRLVPERRRRDPLDPRGHVARGAPRERHQQDAARIGAVHDQMRDPVRERVRLARPGPGDDEKRVVPVQRRAPLFGVQTGQICGYRIGTGCCAIHRSTELCFGFVRKSGSSRDGLSACRRPAASRPPRLPPRRRTIAGPCFR